MHSVLRCGHICNTTIKFCEKKKGLLSIVYEAQFTQKSNQAVLCWSSTCEFAWLTLTSYKIYMGKSYWISPTKNCIITKWQKMWRNFKMQLLMIFQWNFKGKKCQFSIVNSVAIYEGQQKSLWNQAFSDQTPDSYLTQIITH